MGVTKRKSKKGPKGPFDVAHCTYFNRRGQHQLWHDRCLYIVLHCYVNAIPPPRAFREFCRIAQCYVRWHTLKLWARDREVLHNNFGHIKDPSDRKSVLIVETKMDRLVRNLMQYYDAAATAVAYSEPIRYTSLTGSNNPEQSK